MNFHKLASFDNLQKIASSVSSKRLIPTFVQRAFSVESWRIFQPIQCVMEGNNAKCVLSPPSCVKGMKVLDKQKFKKTVSVPSLKIAINNISKFGKSKELGKLGLKLPRVNRYANLSESEPDKEAFKRILLNPDTCPSPDALSSDLIQKLNAVGIDMSTWEVINVDLTYDNWKFSDIFAAVLPTETGILAGFSSVGHIIHLNLRNELLDYKHIIGEVLLHKVKNARTVVNKTDSIDNTFRNFKMEVIAGEEEFITTEKENGMLFKMDFSKVYWNSRLGTEHQRLVEMFEIGDIVFDMFAGIGPFAIPAAKKKCTVYANDLNPESYKWLNENIKLNKIKVPVETYNLDARDFAVNVLKPNLTKLLKTGLFKETVHIIMNLPALAIEFTDVFVGLLSQEKSVTSTNNIPSVVVYCYCFLKNVNGKEEASSQAKESLSEYLCENLPDVEVRFVRDVAPNKDMYCIKFNISKLLFCQRNYNEVSEPSPKKIKH